MIKNLFIYILYGIISILISTIILTIFNYFNIFPSNIIKILKLIIPLICISINCYLLGKKSIKKGYLEGMKFGGIITLLFILIALITKTFKPKSFIYYLIILLTSTLSSMIGINKKKVSN